MQLLYRHSTKMVRRSREHSANSNLPIKKWLITIKEPKLTESAAENY